MAAAISFLHTKDNAGVKVADFLQSSCYLRAEMVKFGLIIKSKVVKPFEQGPRDQKEQDPGWFKHYNWMSVYQKSTGLLLRILNGKSTHGLAKP